MKNSFELRNYIGCKHFIWVVRIRATCAWRNHGFDFQIFYEILSSVMSP